MKLIIDIPCEAYYTFKCDSGKGILTALAEIVANGTPYEERPKGDLISREALRKRIDDCKYFNSSFQKMTVAEFLTIIHDIINKEVEDGES